MPQRPLNPTTPGDPKEGSAAFEAALVAGFAEARRRHPEFEVPFDPFRERVLALSTERPLSAGEVHELALSDLYLATACNLGVKEAWERLLEEHRPHLDQRARRWKLPADAVDDLFGDLLARPGRTAQETRLATYDGRGSLASWLAVILWRSARREGRTRSGVTPIHLDPLAATGMPDPEPEPLARLVTGEAERAMRDALVRAWQGFSVQERLALIHKYGDGRRQQETARVLGISEATVSRRLASALQRLRDELRNAFSDETEVRALLDGPEVDALCKVLAKELDRLARPGRLGEEPRS